MSELSRALIAILVIALACAGTWFGRGWYDGTLITKAQADSYAQGRADASAESAVTIERATVAKNAALRQLGAARAPVNLECPPGTGSVSDDAFDRYKAVP